MIDFYAWPTPNGYKVAIMLEELELPHTIVPVDLNAGEQFAPEFVKVNPNSKMPAIVDRDAPGGPLSVFESGAILMYLAEKTGRFWPTETRARYEVMEWVMWQMGGLGPMMGQAAHFKSAAEKIPYAQNRYMNETKRLFAVLDRRLADREFIAGDYSIADMLSYPWTAVFKFLEMDIGEYPNLRRWQGTMAARPAVAKGMQLLAEKRKR